MATNSTLKNYLKFLPIFLFVIMMLTGCAGQTMAVFLATKNETHFVQLRDNDFAYWSGKIKDRRIDFENDIDLFIIRSLKESEDNNVLTADGVAYLMTKEAELRTTFDANEQIAIDTLKKRLNGYDDMAKLNREAIRELAEQNIAMAEKVNQLNTDLQSEIQKLAFSTMIGRQSKLNGEAAVGPVIEPSTSGVVVPLLTESK